MGAADQALRRFAAEVGEQGAVAVEGSRSRWGVGGDLRAGTRLVRAPAGVMEHRPEEMTVRVRAGTAVRALAEALEPGGQRTALPDRGGTVGGALAVGENHVDVLRRGTVRASVLQVRYVAADGRLITGGGPTVKNVTGYDLPRLMVGALGTLGLLAEVILRTNPVPDASVWLRADDADPFPLIAGLRRRATVLWDGTRTWVHLEGHPGDVRAQRAALPGRWDEVAGGPDLPAHRWSWRPSDLRQLPTDATGPFVASVGVGTVFASEPPAPRPMAEPLRRLGRWAKATFDPAGRLNPGRDPARR